MCSIGEEELGQMVRDYIESADSRSSITEVLGKHTDEEIEIHEKISLYMKNMDQTKNQKKWLVMKLKMDGYEASLCTTTWDSTFRCSKVFQFTENYEYIEVSIAEKKNGRKPTRLIVDTEFRSQFEMARPTRTYKTLINTLPSIFVGTEGKVKVIISLLCPAGKKSLKEKGLHIPPWRSASYLQSKWLSTNCKKVTFSSNELGMDQSEKKLLLVDLSYLAEGKTYTFQYPEAMEKTTVMIEMVLACF